MLCVYRVHKALRRQRWRHEGTGLISIEDLQQIVYAESNGHVTDDVTQPYDVNNAAHTRRRLPACIFNCHLILRSVNVISTQDSLQVNN